MAVNVAINEDLLAAAYQISGLKTKQETVNLALEEFLQNRQRKEAMEMLETIEFSSEWTPRKARGKV